MQVNTLHQKSAYHEQIMGFYRSRIRQWFEQEAPKNSLVKLAQMWTSGLNDAFSKGFKMTAGVSCILHTMTFTCISDENGFLCAADGQKVYKVISIKSIP